MVILINFLFQSKKSLNFKLNNYALFPPFMSYHPLIVSCHHYLKMVFRENLLVFGLCLKLFYHFHLCLVNTANPIFQLTLKFDLILVYQLYYRKFSVLRKKNACPTHFIEFDHLLGLIKTHKLNKSCLTSHLLNLI